MRRGVRWGLVVVGALALMGWLAVRGLTPAKSGDDSTATATVQRGTVKDEVVDSGTIDAVLSVEVKSRVGGRLQKLLVEEGDFVKKGDLIAIVDPQETELKVRQDEAQLRGATSGIERTSIEIRQRRETTEQALKRATLRVRQLEEEQRAQPELTRTAIKAAEANLANARAALALLRQSEHPSERASVQGSLDEAKANLENAERELRRQQGLLDRGFVAARDVEDARLRADLARTRLRTAQDRMDRLEAKQLAEQRQAEERLNQAASELARAKASAFQDRTKRMEYEMALADKRASEAALADVAALEKSRAQGQASADQIRSVLDDSRRLLRETQIRSPIDGVVTVKFIQVGELISPLSSFSTGTSIVRVEDQTAMRVLLNVNEIDVVKLRRDMPVVIEVDALPDEKLQGVVHRIAPASATKSVQSQAGATSTDQVVKYAVEVRLSSKDARLRSGMSAKVRLLVAERKGVLKLPAEFVGKDDTGRFVEIASTPSARNKQDQRQTVRITTGVVTNADVEITGGVKEGQVVLRPKYKGPKRQGFMEGGVD